MFKLEKLLLFLLICVCLVVTVTLLDAVIGPSNFISTVYARLNDGIEPVQDEIYLPDLEESTEEILQETVEEISILVETGWDVFRNEGYSFEIQFPKQVVQKSILNQDVINSGIGLAPEAPVWQFRVDNPLYYQGTNLIDASLFIHVLEGEDQEEACLAFKQGSIYQTPNQKRDSLIDIDINGVPFSKDEVLEGGMGEFFHRISYRTFVKGACYELTQMLHYRNLAGLVGSEVTEFDQEAVINELDQVMSTFIFLDIEPTFPEQSYPVPKTISTAVSKAASEYVDGLDVSHWQGTINWNLVADAGYVFTFAKGTEGVGWTDVKFHENMEGGNDAGVMMGVYHFARPNFGNTGEEEADYFLSVAGDYLNSGYLRPVLDLEVGSSLGKTALTNWVLEWMETVKDRTGIEPLIYTNLNFINYYLTEEVTEY
ncbi:MAG: glycoside hydrolase family 25 protein, partial [Bacteroidales bacterium]|nr:glycoside hydrolase family 25 protein [Bacteroidales bacterium]